jgi:hypothetical protein
VTTTDDAVALLAAVAAVAAILDYRRARPRVPPGHYSPRLAWLRAALYFCFATLLAWISGVLHTLLHEAPVTAQQLRNPTWQVLASLTLAQLVFGYAILWPRGTVTYGRPRRIALAIAFGTMWGLAQGQLVLCLYAGVSRLVPGPWWTIAVMLLLTSAFIGNWHSRYWDIHVSPDHNVREWNLRKVLFAHTPFLVLSLTFLVLYRNALLFVLAQAAALACAAVAMHFPAPWDAPTPQHRPEGRSRVAAQV